MMENEQILPSKSFEIVDTFISYSTVDRKIVKQLYLFLKSIKLNPRLRVNPYFDQTHMTGGLIESELNAALDKASSLIVVCSKASANSPWVKIEIERFLKNSEKIALVLVSDEKDNAIPTPIKNLDIRIHDIRNGFFLFFWKPQAKVELLRLTAWLTNQNLSSLINWDRRRTIKSMLYMIISLSAPISATYYIMSGLKPLENSEIKLKLIISWISEDGKGEGASIINTFLDSSTFVVEICKISERKKEPQWKFPLNSQIHAGLENNPTKFNAKLDSNELKTYPSTAGVWFESHRTFSLENQGLGRLSHLNDWKGATVAASYTAIDLGVVAPASSDLFSEENITELTKEAKDFYKLPSNFLENSDFWFIGVPIEAKLEFWVRNQLAGTSSAKAMRVWEHDEDARNLFTLIFKPFKISQNLT